MEFSKKDRPKIQTQGAIQSIANSYSAIRAVGSLFDKMFSKQENVKKRDESVMQDRFQSGDVIGFKLDMTHSSVENDVILEQIWSQSARYVFCFYIYIFQRYKDIP